MVVLRKHRPQLCGGHERRRGVACTTKTWFVRVALQHVDGRLERILPSAEQEATVLARSGTAARPTEAQPKLLEDHNRWTGSSAPRVAGQLGCFARQVRQGVPTEYKRALAEIYERKVLEESATPAVAATKKKQYPPNKVTRRPSHHIHRQGHSVMGKLLASWNAERIEEGYKPVGERLKHYKGIRHWSGCRPGEDAGRALHGLQHAVLQQRLSVNNIIPDFNDLVYRGDWKNAVGAAFDQQLPRVHRPHLPRAVRGGLRAEREQRPVGIRPSGTPSSTAPGRSRVVPSSPRTRPARRWP